MVIVEHNVYEYRLYEETKAIKERNKKIPLRIELVPCVCNFIISTHNDLLHVHRFILLCLPFFFFKHEQLKLSL